MSVKPPGNSVNGAVQIYYIIIALDCIGYLATTVMQQDK